MSDDHAALAGFCGVARLFPLPNLVLFPQVVQKLHIFEPRYRQMTSDALAGDGMIALVLLKPGWEKDYDKRPAIEGVACLGRVIQHERLADGRYNLLVRGIARVRLLEELPADRLYRTARAEPVPDVAPADFPRLVELRKRLADAVLSQFEPTGPAHRQLKELIQGDLPLGHLCDVLAYALPLPLEVRQQLLEDPCVQTRAEVLAAAVSVATPPRTFPPEFSAN
jgi:Lon protease-like protein